MGIKFCKFNIKLEKKKTYFISSFAKTKVTGVMLIKKVLSKTFWIQLSIQKQSLTL